jgi:DNA-binding response OmpR family regulator
MDNLVATNSKFRILLVDDNPVDQQITHLLLEKNGYSVSVLNSATNCMDMIASQKIQLVLLDIMMPFIDGKQLLKMIRLKYTPLELPVIMLTANHSTSEVVESLQLGANDYITKPINFDIATRRIKNQLSLAEESKAQGLLKKIEAIHTTVATYNHEINNPLAICIAKLTLLRRKYDHDVDIENLEKAFWRISEVLKEMEDLLEN